MLVGSEATAVYEGSNILLFVFAIKHKKLLGNEGFISWNVSHSIIERWGWVDNKVIDHTLKRSSYAH